MVDIVNNNKINVIKRLHKDINKIGYNPFMSINRIKEALELNNWNYQEAYKYLVKHFNDTPSGVGIYKDFRLIEYRNEN